MRALYFNATSIGVSTSSSTEKITASMTKVRVRAGPLP